MAARAASGRLTIFERADSLPPVWDRVAAGGGLALETRLLRPLEQSAIHATRRYMVYETASGDAVVAVGDLLQGPATSNPVMSILLGRLGAYFPSVYEWQLPMLVLRSEFAGDAPYAASHSTPESRAALLRGLVTELETHADRHAWSLAFSDVPPDDRAMTIALTGNGYLQTLARPCATLRLEWDSWETYLRSAARQSHRLAHNIRREIKRAHREGLTIVEWNPAQTPGAELCRLMAQHEQNLNNLAWRFEPGLLERLSQSLGTDCRVLVATSATALQGTTVVMVSGKRGYVKYPGLVARADRADFTYFNLVYYEPIRLGISLGLESLAYGNGAYQAKIRRGCTVRANHLYFRPRNPLLRSLLRAPGAAHRRILERKYAAFLQATPFSNISSRSHAHPAHERAS